MTPAAESTGTLPATAMPSARRLLADPTFWAVWGLALLVFVLDRVTKAWAEQVLAPVGTMPLFGEWLRFTYVRNTGVAFGLGAGKALPLVAITLVALAMVGALAFSARSRTWPRSIALGLIIGGAAGNLLDRARWGSVIDFVDFGFRHNWWPVFNAADSAITVGVILFALTLLGESGGSHERHAPAPDPSGGAGGPA